MEENKQIIVGLYLTTGQIVMGELLDNNDIITVKNPYFLNIENGKIVFIPYLNEFSDDEEFSFVNSSIVNVFKPYDKYIVKYSEIQAEENKKQQLLS